MNCKQIHQSLIFYLDRELAADQHTAFEKHLEQCPKCVAFLEEMKSVLGIIEQEKKIESNPFLITRIEQRLENEKESIKAPIFSPLFKRVFQPVAFSFLVVLSIFIGTRLGASLQAYNSTPGEETYEEFAYFNEMEQEVIETFLIGNE